MDVSDQGRVTVHDEELISALLSHLRATAKTIPSPIVVGIDGPDCAGKTTLSISLLQRLMLQETAIVVHCDDYRNDLAYRERRGKYSAEGFLNDYFNHEAIQRSVLDPFSKQKMRGGRPDYVFLEGLFLFRSPIDEYLDVRIRMEIEEERVMSRAVQRDVGVIGDEALVRKRYTELAIPAQRRYREIVDPGARAHINIRVLDDGIFTMTNRF